MKREAASSHHRSRSVRDRFHDNPFSLLLNTRNTNSDVPAPVAERGEEAPAVAEALEVAAASAELQPQVLFSSWSSGSHAISVRRLTRSSLLLVPFRLELACVDIAGIDFHVLAPLLRQIYFGENGCYWANRNAGSTVYIRWGRYRVAGPGQKWDVRLRRWRPSWDECSPPDKRPRKPCPWCQCKAPQ